MKKLYLGIDNGLDGGICAVDESGTLIDKSVMPVLKKGKGRDVDVNSIAEYFARENRDDVKLVILIEEASKHSAGTLALCSTWFSFGSILTAIKLGSYQHEIVRPQQWQKAFWTRPKMPKGQKFDTKAAAQMAANRIWPNTDWTKSERATTPHDGMIDAALIAEYGRRNNL